MEWKFSTTPNIRDSESAAHDAMITVSRAREWYRLRLSNCPYQRPFWRPPADLGVSYDAVTLMPRRLR